MILEDWGMRQDYIFKTNEKGKMLYILSSLFPKWNPQIFEIYALLTEFFTFKGTIRKVRMNDKTFF